MKVVYAERARVDIADIYDSIAQHNPAAAQRVEDVVRATCEGLPDFPYASVATSEPNVRRVPLVRSTCARSGR
jgi:plasmid stabilization system protein ParE